MQQVKTQRFGELFVKNMLIFYFYMVIIKTYAVKKKHSLTNFRNWNKFPEISVNFPGEISGNFRTHNLNEYAQNKMAGVHVGLRRKIISRRTV